tara:strand:+ start:447 stop:662 length:216 start_codon:yes stop_codon:yes gene_type:complete
LEKLSAGIFAWLNGLREDRPELSPGECVGIALGIFLTHRVNGYVRYSPMAYFKVMFFAHDVVISWVSSLGF